MNRDQNRGIGRGGWRPHAAIVEHGNARAAKWFLKGHRFATCPITQGALFRFHVRAGVEARAESAKVLLESISSLPRHEFWPDDVSYLDMPTAGIAGHRQVTDAYLVLLARLLFTQGPHSPRSSLPLCQKEWRGRRA